MYVVRHAGRTASVDCAVPAQRHASATWNKELELTAAISLDVAWEQACAYLAQKLSQDVYSRWIAVIKPKAFDGQTLTLRVENDFYQSWLEEHYLPLIRTALAAVYGFEPSIVFAVEAAAVPPAPEPRPEETKPTRGVRNSSERPLTPSFSFETFVIGPSNMFAHAAALAVAQAPARAYNPLLIHGGSGLGKTHLMQAVGHYVLRQPHANVCYTTGETFTNEYIEALKKQALTGFRRKYRQTDVLLIDDIHFLANKPQIQEEFFHTFNDLHNRRSQIVLTCDRPAAEIEGMQKRLITRFEWGLVTELDRPDFETRVAILRKKREQLELSVDEPVLLFIAEHLHSDIRRLEGALICCASYVSLTGRALNQEALESLLQNAIAQEQSAAPTIEAVQRAVAEFFDLRLSDMTSKQRPQAIAWPRQVAMFLSRKLTQQSLPTIGNAFARNHATVLYACRAVEARMQSDQGFRQTLVAIQQRLDTSVRERRG